MVNAISTHGEMSPVWSIFLWLVVTDNTAISICASLKDIWFVDKDASIGAVVLANALEQWTKFIGKALCPFALKFGDLDELAIFKCVACVVINGGADEACQVSTQDVCLDQNSLSGLQVSVMKFIEFDGKGSIRH